MNNQLLVMQRDSDTFAISFALVISLAMHFAVMHALPWLDAVKTKPAINIIAELQTLPPPPPAVSMPAEPLQPEAANKPDVVKKEKLLKPAPVLATQTEAAPKEYAVPDTPQVEAPASESAPTVAHEAAPASSESANGSLKSVATSSSTGSEEVSSEEAWDGYGQALYEMVGKNKNYPAIAVRRSWEGEAKVMAKFILGKLIDIALISSSGHQALDDEALAMVRKAVNQLPIKGNLAKKTFTITVPVDFKLAEQ